MDDLKEFCTLDSHKALSHTLGPTCILKVNYNILMKIIYLYIYPKIKHQKFTLQNLSKLIIYQHATFCPDKVKSFVAKC